MPLAPTTSPPSLPSPCLPSVPKGGRSDYFRPLYGHWYLFLECGRRGGALHASGRHRNVSLEFHKSNQIPTYGRPSCQVGCVGHRQNTSKNHPPPVVDLGTSRRVSLQGLHPSGYLDRFEPRDPSFAQGYQTRFARSAFRALDFACGLF